MAILTSGGPAIAGTEEADILIALASVRARQTTIDAGAGNDVLIADHAAIVIDAAAGNADFATALSLDHANYWSAAHDPLVADDRQPHATIVGTGANAPDFFKIRLVAGATITLDVDFAMGGLGGPGWDSMLQLFDSRGNLLRGIDDDLSIPGGLGSIHHYDSYLTYTVPADGIYYIKLARYSNFQPIEAGSNYLLNMSVSDHAARPASAVSGDVLKGGDGDDYMVGNAGADRIEGGRGADVAFGADGDDVILGHSRADDLIGGGGSDALYGGSGNDRLDGGIGDDLLDGGYGIDYLTGGEGSDIFQFSKPLDGRGDVLTDFVSGEDKIDIAHRYVAGLDRGDLPEGAFAYGSAATEADDRILFDIATGRLLYDADGIGGADAVLIATVLPGIVTAADITIV